MKNLNFFLVWGWFSVRFSLEGMIIFATKEKVSKFRRNVWNGMSNTTRGNPPSVLNRQYTKKFHVQLQMRWLWVLLHVKNALRIHRKVGTGSVLMETADGVGILTQRSQVPRFPLSGHGFVRETFYFLLLY